MAASDEVEPHTQPPAAVAQAGGRYAAELKAIRADARLSADGKRHAIARVFVRRRDAMTRLQEGEQQPLLVGDANRSGSSSASRVRRPRGRAIRRD